MENIQYQSKGRHAAQAGLMFSQSDSQNGSDDYNPDQAYNYERAHTEPERDKNGHPMPPSPKRPNNLAVAALAASLATILLCCCSPYASILSAIMGLTLAICSRFYNNEERRLYPQAVAAIIISVIALILILGSIFITYVLLPQLLESSPEFKEYYTNFMKLFMEALEEQQ